VTARTSSFAFKNRNRDIREIAAQLAVTHVLEGSVRRAGDHVRVTAQLISAETGFHTFSETYDSALADVFGVQDEIARKIVERLADQLGPVRTSHTERQVAVRHSHDTRAHSEYLRGRFENARFSPEGARRAIKHYERAMEMDPDCALPYAGLAESYVFLGTIGHMRAEDALSRAETAATRAVELEPDAGPSHVALGIVQLFHTWDFAGAYRSFQKALSLTPGSADAHHFYSMYLAAIGDFAESLEESRTAVQLDPLAVVYNDFFAHTLAANGRMKEAFAQIEHTIQMDPLFRSAVETLGWFHVLEGDMEAALTAFERLPGMAGVDYAAASDRAYAYARLGRMADVERMLALLDARRDEQPDMNLDIDYALVHEGLGDRERALQYLSSAIDRRLGAVVMLDCFTSWRGARQDPRFKALLRRVGLPQALVENGQKVSS
jgi:adenylate cyclase